VLRIQSKREQIEILPFNMGGFGIGSDKVEYIG
jgi:hypothetical protein